MEKKTVEGKLMPFSENYGWYIQDKIDVHKNDNGVRNLGFLLPEFIGKKVRITVEEIE